MLKKTTLKYAEKGKNEIFITEGFPYQKGQSGNDIIKIAKVEKGIFTATEDSVVPTRFEGPNSFEFVVGVTGGSFIPTLNAKPGTKSLTDMVGNKWIFSEPDISFDVFFIGLSEPNYNLKSKVKNASISFTKEGVLLKGFELTKY